jgi:hypothetical protein
VDAAVGVTFTRSVPQQHRHCRAGRTEPCKARGADRLVRLSLLPAAAPRRAHAGGRPGGRARKYGRAAGARAPPSVRPAVLSRLPWPAAELHVLAPASQQRPGYSGPPRPPLNSLAVLPSSISRAQLYPVTHRRHCSCAADATLPKVGPGNYSSSAPVPASLTPPAASPGDPTAGNTDPRLAQARRAASRSSIRGLTLTAAPRTESSHAAGSRMHVAHTGGSP